MDGVGWRAQLGGRSDCRRCDHAMGTARPGQTAERTLVICTAPFLTPANARVERRQDLASMVGTPCGAYEGVVGRIDKAIRCHRRCCEVAGSSW